MPEIVIRTDGSAKEGTGHLIRSFTLASLFSKAGNRVRVWSDSTSEFGTLFSMHSVETAPVSCDEKRDLKTLAPQILLTDLPPGKDRDPLSNHAKRLGIFHAAINDLMLSNGNFDICINPSIVPTFVPQKKTTALQVEKSFPKLFSGSKYTVLNSNITTRKPRTSLAPKCIKTILFSMGGTDPENLTEEALLTLLPQVPHESTVLVIAASPSQKLLSLGRSFANMQLYEHPENFADLLGMADIAILSAGITLYEACFLGTPSIALPQNKFQEMTAKEVESRGATMLVERNKIVGGKKMSKVFKNLVDSFQVRSDISANGKKLIDGKGAHRVVRLVLDTYKDFLNNSKGEG